MCGVSGIYSGGSHHASVAVYESLNRLQHRGQDATGIACQLTDGDTDYKVGEGLVAQVFPKQLDILQSENDFAIGHVRYRTSGRLSARATQPLVCPENSIYLAHNGQLVNIDHIRRYLESEGVDCADAEVDTALLLLLFVHCLKIQRSIHDDVLEAVFATCRQVIEKVRGAYSVVVLIKDVGLLAFRDAHGIRPLSWGKRIDPVNGRTEYAFVSESGALPAGFVNKGDVPPATAMLVDTAGSYHVRPVGESLRPITLCLRVGVSSATRCRHRQALRARCTTPFRSAARQTDTRTIRG